MTDKDVHGGGIGILTNVNFALTPTFVNYDNRLESRSTDIQLLSVEADLKT